MNLTPPWDRADAKGAAGGAGSTAVTTEIGGTVETGGSTATGGNTDPMDAPVAGSSGQGGGGSSGQDAAVDPPSSGTAGTGGQGGGTDAGTSSGGNTDAGVPDAPKGGSGGAGVGGTVVGGTSASGGSAGGAGSGGSSTGGTGGTSSSKPDAGPDANPLLNGLVVYYRFESASGTTLPDSSGKGNDGTLSSGPAPDGGVAPSGPGYEFVNGKVGKALALHKAGLGYVRIPPAVFANLSELTVAAWVNVTTEQSWQRILDVGVTPNPYQFGNPPTGTKYLNIVPKASGTNGNMMFSISSNGYSNEQSLSAPSMAANTWTHVAVVLPAGGGARLYVNGTENAYSASVTLRPSNLGAIDYAFIGKSRFDADPAFDGMLDCFRVYNRALSAAEVLALFNNNGS